MAESSFGSPGHELDNKETRIAKSGGKITGVGTSTLKDAAETISTVRVSTAAASAFSRTLPLLVGAGALVLTSWVLSSQRPDAQLVNSFVEAQKQAAKAQEQRDKQHSQQIEELGKMLKTATRPTNNFALVQEVSGGIQPAMMPESYGQGQGNNQQPYYQAPGQVPQQVAAQPANPRIQEVSTWDWKTVQDWALFCQDTGFSGYTDTDKQICEGIRVRTGM